MMTDKKQQDALVKVCARVVDNINEYYQQFGKPIRSSVLRGSHRGVVYNNGLEWFAIEDYIKSNGLAEMYLTESNMKWYFPKTCDLDAESKREYVKLLEPVPRPTKKKPNNEQEQQ
jgi:hypothetical protein